MKSLDDRKKGFEAAFQRDQELAFKIGARRNRLFGLWAAAQLGMSAGEVAEAYAKTVVAADFEEPGDDDVIRKVRTDLTEKGLDISDAQLRSEFARAAAEARRQLTES